MAAVADIASLKRAQEPDQEPEKEHPQTAREWSARSILAICGGMICFFCSSGFFNAFGVFLAYYHQTLLQDKSAFTISWIGSFGNFLLFICAAPAGVLVDKIGPTLPLYGGSMIALVAIFMTSLCTDYYQFFLAQGTLLGMGMAFILLPAVSTVPKYFVKHRGLALGIVVTGSSLGGVIWPIMVEQLLNVHHLSFGWTMRIVGFTMLILFPVAWFTLRPLQQTVLTGSESDSEDVRKSKQHKKDLSIAKDLTFLVMCAGVTICYFGFFTPFYYVTSYSISLGHPTNISFYLVSILNGASSFGRVIPGYLADRWGVFNTFIMFSLFAGVTALSWTAAKSVAGLVVWTMAYGFSSGAILSLQQSYSAQLSTPKTHGTAMGMSIGFAAIAGLFGSPISGALVEYGYLGVSMYTGACIMVGTLLVTWSRLRQDRRLIAKV